MNVTLKSLVHQSFHSLRPSRPHQSKPIIQNASPLLTTIPIHYIHHTSNLSSNSHKHHQQHHTHHPTLFYLHIAKSFTNTTTPSRSKSTTTKSPPGILDTKSFDKSIDEPEQSEDDPTPTPSPIDEPKNTEQDVTKITKDDEKIDKRAYPIAFSSLLMGIGIGVILPVMPQFANEIGINTMQYGLVISVMGITRLICNIPAGVITDKFGRKSTLVGGPIISALGMLITINCFILTIYPLIFFMNLTVNN